jgi:hydrogenase-4 component B
MTGALALASFAKAGAMIFLGAPRTKPAAQAHDCGARMRGAMLTVAGVCVAMGLAPVLFWPAVSRAADAWHPALAATEPPAPLLTLGLVHLALAVLALCMGVLLWRKARTNGLRRGLTWDCGYAAPAAKMQYTSGSFAGIAAGWFTWILRPVRHLRRPRGHFPPASIRLERTPDTVLEQVIAPAGRRLIRISTAVRRLQHGRLQSYILYVVAGLVALGVIVLL